MFVTVYRHSQQYGDMQAERKGHIFYQMIEKLLCSRHSVRISPWEYLHTLLIQNGSFTLSIIQTLLFFQSCSFQPTHQPLHVTQYTQGLSPSVWLGQTDTMFLLMGMNFLHYCLLFSPLRKSVALDRCLSHENMSPILMQLNFSDMLE